MHLCDAVLTDLIRRGIDPSLLHADRLIAAVAKRQEGVVARSQLEQLGVGRGAVQRRVERGLLQRRHRGVYVWGGSGPARPRTAVIAAVYGCGEGSLLGGLAAGSLWSMIRERRGPADVTVVGRRVRRDAIRIHEVAHLDPRDIRNLGPLPIASPARTLVELAALLGARELAAAVERAQVDRLVTKPEVAAALDRAAGRRGTHTLRSLVDEPAFTRSHAERMIVALTRAAELPRPHFNASVEGMEVDVVWRCERVVLEFDSYAFHATRAAFERDRRRDAVLARAGFLVLRTTWTELTRRSPALVARVAEALASRRAGAGAISR